MNKHKLNRFTKRNKQAGLIIIVLVLAAWALSAAGSKKSHLDTDTPTQGKQASSDTKSLDLAMVGDMLPHETVTNAAKTSDGYDYVKLISKDLQASFKKADLHFCNQEAVAAADISVQGYPTFNAPVEFSRDINKLGCDTISTANNHAADQGLAGIKGTRDTWDKVKSATVSGTYRDATEEEKLNIIEKNGIKIGFTAFNEVNNINPPASGTGVNMLSDQKSLEQQINGLKEKSDVVVVSVHWGTEDSHTLTAAQKNYAQKVSDLGADIIIGTGPHVWQPYQVLNRPDGGKTHVWYSIGNGLNSQTKQDQLFSGIALLNIKKNQQGKVEISSPRVLPTYMHYIWGQGVGLSQDKLLARKDLLWGISADSTDLISKRNDFTTTAEEQAVKLKGYINNPEVELIKAY